MLTPAPLVGVNSPHPALDARATSTGANPPCGHPSARRCERGRTVPATTVHLRVTSTAPFRWSARRSGSAGAGGRAPGPSSVRHPRRTPGRSGRRGRACPSGPSSRGACTMPTPTAPRSTSSGSGRPQASHPAILPGRKGFQTRIVHRCTWLLGVPKCRARGRHGVAKQMVGGATRHACSALGLGW